MIPSWRVTRQHLYQNPGVTGGQTGTRDRSLPPRVWSAARNQVTSDMETEGIMTQGLYRRLLIRNGKGLLRITGETKMALGEAGRGRGTPDRPSGITNSLRSNQSWKLRLQGLKSRHQLRRNAPTVTECSASSPLPTPPLGPAARR